MKTAKETCQEIEDRKNRLRDDAVEQIQYEIVKRKGSYTSDKSDKYSIRVYREVYRVLRDPIEQQKFIDAGYSILVETRSSWNPFSKNRNSTVTISACCEDSK